MQQHFTGRLTARDCKRHISFPFTVPPNAARIEIDLRFTPAGAHGLSNMLTLTVFDPRGCRGAGHRGGPAHHVRIGPADATPGYVPGPLPPGEWIAQVDTHMIMPGPGVEYTLDVSVSTAEPVAPAAAPLAEPGSITRPQRGPGWYRGDLHSHTDHSDARERSVADLVRWARGYGLDFIFLTDHNTISGLAEMEARGDTDLLTAGGVELTTFWGHALCLGGREWVDWRVRPGSDAMARIAAAAESNGQLFVIAHPQAPGDPACTGCSWRYGEMMPGNAHVVEIWNGPWAGDSNNEAALALWYDWLNQGRRMVATAGTDSHSNSDYAEGPGFNVIGAEALTESALLAAVRAGRLYLSSGPRLTFEAQDARGTRWGIGQSVAAGAGALTFEASWSDCPPGAEARVMVDGRLYDARPAGGAGQGAWALQSEQATWVVLEVRAADGVLLAITNPIFV